MICLGFGIDDWEETREWSLADPAWHSRSSQEELLLRRAEEVREKRKKKLQRVFGALLVFLFFLALLTLGYYWAGGRVRMPGMGAFMPPAAASQKAVPVLLLGTDQRDPGEPARADTIIVAFLDQKQKKVRLLSIPRDTYAFLSGCSRKGKINVSHALGGPEATARAVSDLLGIDVRYYVETNFEGFVRIVDTLGGVTINVDRRMYYPAEGIDLYPGVQCLNGKDALAFVRFRGYPLGDIGRIKQQQRFFSALADQALQLRNIWHIPDLVRALRSCVKTNLTIPQMVKLGGLFKSIDSGQVETYILPGALETIKGGSYWVPREKEAFLLVTALVEGISLESTPPEESSLGVPVGTGPE